MAAMAPAPPIRAWLALAAAATALALGCVPRGEKLPPGVIAVEETEQTASFVRNFNPLLEAGSVRWPTRRAMYEPMLIHNPLLGQYVPWLAEGYTWSEDRRQLRFSLRRDVTWSDGAPFGARDVVYTFQLLRRYPALDGRGLWEHLAAVAAEGDHTVVVTLTRAHAPALEPIAQQAIVPEHRWRDVADPVSFANEKPVATGPFTEVTFFQPQVYEVGRNPRYWQAGKPALRALRFRAYASNEQAILALLHGELDWAGSFIPAIRRVYRARDPQHHHYWFPLLDATVFLYANTRRPPLDDARVRKALSMAIDRPRIAAIAMHGYTRPADATGLSDAFARYRDPAAVAAGDWVRFDPPRAERLLDEVGLRRGPDGRRRLPGGRPFALTVQVQAGFSDWIAAAQIAARGLRSVGLEVALRTSEENAWFERLQTGDFDLSMAWSDLVTTPYGFYRSLMSTATVQPIGQAAPANWHRFGLPQADRVLAELEGVIDPLEEKRLVGKLQWLFVEHAPAIPLFPGTLWGEFNTRRASGFPDENAPYAPLAPYIDGPQTLLVLTRLHPSQADQPGDGERGGP
jgi:peptide/nickel transport system substrate-binding protein